jgi:hypothetical protein
MWQDISLARAEEGTLRGAEAAVRADMPAMYSALWSNTERLDHHFGHKAGMPVADGMVSGGAPALLAHNGVYFKSSPVDWGLPILSPHLSSNHTGPLGHPYYFRIPYHFLFQTSCRRSHPTKIKSILSPLPMGSELKYSANSHTMPGVTWIEGGDDHLGDHDGPPPQRRRVEEAGGAAAAVTR